MASWVNSNKNNKSLQSSGSGKRTHFVSWRDVTLLTTLSTTRCDLTALTLRNIFPWHFSGGGRACYDIGRRERLFFEMTRTDISPRCLIEQSTDCTD